MGNMDKKDSNLKLVIIICTAIAAVLFCYLFSVLYFYNINPYDISAKLVVWPFHTSESKGKMYLDSMVGISFYVNEDFDYVENNISGVNVHKNGWIITSASPFKNLAEDKSITIKPKSGKPYLGNIVFKDDVYNIAILKCENLEDQKGKISIPFVNTANISLAQEKQNLIFASNSLEEKDVKLGYTDSESLCVADYTIVDNKYALDYCLEDCYELYFNKDVENFVGGAVFNEEGSVLGVCNGWKITDGGYVVTPIYSVQKILDELISKKFENNPLFSKIVGFDSIEYDYHQQISIMQKDDISGVVDSFYFNGQWLKYSEVMNDFSSNFMLLEDFVYGEAKIEKYSILNSIQIGDKTKILLDSKLALHDALYKMKSGDTFTLNYTDLHGEKQNLTLVLQGE